MPLATQVFGLSDDYVTFAKIQNIDTNRMLGRGSAGAGDIEQMVLSSDYGLTFTYAASSLKINTPQDLQTGASPTFVTVKLSTLTDGYVPYHVADATGLANTNIYTNATNVSIGRAYAAATMLRVYGGTTSDYPDCLRLQGGSAKAASGPCMYFQHGYAPEEWELAAILAQADGYGVSYRGSLRFYVNYGLSATSHMNVLSLYLSADAVTCYADFGWADARCALLRVFGGATGYAQGGIIQLFAAADHDTTIDNYAISSYEDDLLIGPSTDTDALKMTAEGLLVYTMAGGKVGIGTATVPHGGVGSASTLLALEAAAPLVIQYTISTTDYPLLQYYGQAQDVQYYAHKAYNDGSWRFSHSTAAHIDNIAGNLRVFYTAASGGAGTVISAFIPLLAFDGYYSQVLLGSDVTLGSTYGIFIIKSTAVGGYQTFIAYADTYGTLTFNAHAHDNVELIFDADIRWAGYVSGDVGSNFRIAKASDVLKVDYATGVAQGSAISWSAAPGLAITSAGKVGIGTSAVPHGAIGTALLAIDGAAPVGIQVTCTTSDYPAIASYILSATSVIPICSGCYYDGANWKWSRASHGAFRVTESLQWGVAYGFAFQVATTPQAHAAGDTITWYNGLSISQTDQDVFVGIGYGAGSPPRIAALSTACLEVIANTNCSAFFGQNSTNEPGIVLKWDHNSQAIMFDAYYYGGWKSSYNAGNGLIYFDWQGIKMYCSGVVAVGGAITWNLGLDIDLDGDVGIGVVAPAARCEIEDGATANSILLKITQDDATVYGLVIGNDTYSTTDTNGLTFLVNNDGTAVINWTGTSLGLGKSAPTHFVEIYDATPTNYATLGLHVQSDVTTKQFIAGFTNKNTEGVYIYHAGSDGTSYGAGANIVVIAADYFGGGSYRNLAFASHNRGMLVIDGNNYDIVIGVGEAGVDYQIKFDGETNDGWITWREDEDYFEFDDDILLSTTEKVQFRDTAIYIASNDDGHLDLMADISIDLNTGADTDLVVNFFGTTNSGVLTWMEDEAYFKTSSVVRAATSLYRRYYHISLASANPGASGATWVNPGANSTGGWRLDAASETLHGETDVHSDWDGASDLKAEVRFYVNVDNTGGADADTVDIKIIFYYKGVGDTATKTQTVEVATVVGKSAQYKAFEADFTIDYDAGGNVVEAGDVLGMLLNLETDSSEVDDIVVTGISFSYNTTHIGIESGDI